MYPSGRRSSRDLEFSSAIPRVRDVEATVHHFVTAFSPRSKEETFEDYDRSMGQRAGRPARIHAGEPFPPSQHSDSASIHTETVRHRSYSRRFRYRYVPAGNESTDDQFQRRDVPRISRVYESEREVFRTSLSHGNERGRDTRPAQRAYRKSPDDYEDDDEMVARTRSPSPLLPSCSLDSSSRLEEGATRTPYSTASHSTEGYPSDSANLNSASQGTGNSALLSASVDKLPPILGELDEAGWAQMRLVALRKAAQEMKDNLNSEKRLGNQ